MVVKPFYKLEDTAVGVVGGKGRVGAWGEPCALVVRKQPGTVRGGGQAVVGSRDRPIA